MKRADWCKKRILTDAEVSDKYLYQLEKKEEKISQVNKADTIAEIITDRIQAMAVRILLVENLTFAHFTDSLIFSIELTISV